MSHSGFMYCKVEIFIPESYLSALQEALTRVGAGHIGNYDSCLSFSRVTGCWRPLPGSRPDQGANLVLSQEQELKVEVLCLRARVDETLAAIKAAHPYEVPVVNVIPYTARGCSPVSLFFRMLSPPHHGLAGRMAQAP